MADLTTDIVTGQTGHVAKHNEERAAINAKLDKTAFNTTLDARVGGPVSGLVDSTGKVVLAKLPDQSTVIDARVSAVLGGPAAGLLDSTGKVVLAKVPDMTTTINAKIDARLGGPASGLVDATGKVVVAKLPVHSTDLLTSGTLSEARLPVISTAKIGDLSAKYATVAKIGNYEEGVLNTFAGKLSASKISVNNVEAATGGYGITAFGANVLMNNVRGWKNTAFGESAMMNNVDGYFNTAVGNSALERNTGGIGPTASKSDNDGGARNVAIGSNAMRYNQTGRGNVGIGRNAAHTNVSGSYNTAVGCNAYSGTYEDDGSSASPQQDKKTAHYNVAVGWDAAFNTNANDNVAVGDHALYANISGTSNTAVGKNALLDLAGDSYNSAFGRSAGETSPAGIYRCTMLGYNAQTTGDYQVQVGGPSTTTYVYGTVQNRSDLRDKADVRDTVLGLDFIEALRPVDYRWDHRDDYQVLNAVTGRIMPTPKDGSKKGKRFHHGLIAQEVAQVIAETGVDFGGYQDHSVNGGRDVLSIGYDELIAPLIKAVQELSTGLSEARAEIASLKNQIQES